MIIKGKTALVTGGASGLGKAIVEMFYAEGANVVIADLNEETGNKAAAELGDRAFFVKTDITDYAEVEKVVKATVDKFGSVNILVNSAGIGGAGKIASKDGPYDVNKFKGIVNVNIIGTYTMTAVSAFAMLKNSPEGADGERGVVIHIASVAAYEGQMGQSAYSCTKGAIVGMTLPMARDLSRDGIRVLTIAPGIFLTPLLGKLPDNVLDGLGKSVPYPSRIGNPQELAQLAKTMVEVPYLNGEVIRIDGGIRMAPR